MNDHYIDGYELLPRHHVWDHLAVIAKTLEEPNNAILHAHENQLMHPHSGCLRHLHLTPMDGPQLVMEQQPHN
jgi:hypothetical protein